ncbi:ParB/RepB/Spo0J family partition protein [Streptomyces sp. SS1-1]|uniref:ParB/RepB/Spo0J family partition protein n=1 Tax=Streptomyces sp. SS1-1 TaxID=2651869 RepID=UPI00178C57E8|nr:plasmid partitioning protein [Streptomyces sp. SS1-1]
MSKEEELGKGASFGRSRDRRSERGRAKALAQGDIPPYTLVRLPLDEVASTPLNPRRRFGTDEDLTRFGEELRAAQLHACVAVSRSAYLSLWPDHAARLEPSAQHVLVNGERRVRSARHVSLTHLDFVIRDDLAATRETFINHVLRENLSRENFDVIERAHGVKSLVEACAEEAGPRGAQTRAADQLGRDKSWVTNQLILLALPEELQTRLSEGTLPERDGRVMARHAKDNPDLDVEGLLAYLDETRQAEKEKKARASAALASVAESSKKDGTETPAIPSPSAPVDTSNGNEGLGTEELETSGSLSADNEPASAAEGKSELFDGDPLEQLDVFRRRAVRFAKEMTGLEETYRLASKANPELAESHLRQILERLDRVGRHLELRQKQSQ